MVWKWWLLFKMAIFHIYVEFLECNYGIIGGCPSFHDMSTKPWWMNSRYLFMGIGGIWNNCYHGCPVIVQVVNLANSEKLKQKTDCRVYTTLVSHTFSTQLQSILDLQGDHYILSWELSVHGAWGAKSLSFGIHGIPTYALHVGEPRNQTVGRLRATVEGFLLDMFFFLWGIFVKYMSVRLRWQLEN